MDQSTFEKLYQQGFDEPILQKWTWHNLNRFFEANHLPNFQDMLKINKVNGCIFSQMEKEEIKEFFDNPSPDVEEKICDTQQLFRKHIEFLATKKNPMSNSSQNFKSNMGNPLGTSMNSSGMSKSEYDQSIMIPVEVNCQNQNTASVNKKPTENLTQNHLTIIQSYIVDNKQLSYNPFDFQQANVIAFMLDNFQMQSLANQFSNLSKPDARAVGNVSKQPELLLEQIELSDQPSRPVKQCFRVLKNEATIGKTSDSYIQLNDQSVSRNHALITYRSNAYYLKDKGSTSGTFIRIKDKSYQVQKDTIIECGLTELEFFQITQAPNSLGIDIRIRYIEGYSPLKGQVTEYKLMEDLPCIIGKNSTCQICIPNDKYINDYHAKLTLVRGAIFIDDLSSD